MKKVLIFSLTYFPFVGGAEVAIREITDRMPNEEFEFHMVTLRFNSKLPLVERIGNITLHRIGFGRSGATTADLKRFPLHLNKHWYQCAAAWHALRLHRKLHFDGTWAMMAHATGIPAGIFKTFHPSVPYLLTLQEGDPPRHIERLAWPVWPLFSRAFTRADVVQAISTFLGAWARRRHFTGPLEIIPNGVDTARFAKVYTPEEREASRHILGVAPETVLLVTTSRLVHKNATDDVIRALAHLPPHVHFIIYGVGPDEAMLRTLAKEQGVESRTHFMGQLSHEAMPRALSACDIFIRPSRSEGMGNSFIEAMAAGLPVIATQEGGIADFLADSKRNPDKETTGWAVDKDDPRQIADTVEDIVAHPEQVRFVIEQAKILALNRYDWNLVAGKMRAVFDTLFI